MREEICLVEQDHICLPLPDALHVAFKARAAVEQRVPGIHDLHNHVALLHHPPQLSPELQVLLEGRQEHVKVLFDARELPPPLEERLLLIGVNLLFAHLLAPCRAHGDRELPLVIWQLLLAVLGDASGSSHDYSCVLPLCREVSVRQLGDAQQGSKVVLVNHRRLQLSMTLYCFFCEFLPFWDKMRVLGNVSLEDFLGVSLGKALEPFIPNRRPE
mmetsp:Transcript_6576/g.15017  ORF Transcript_6576/g.15017 Transcript_6576/m.15017 type:complete len:215 (+) Transcript_6576:1305-1949(+)